MSGHQNFLKQAINLIDEKEVIRVVQEMVQIPSINPPGHEKEITEYIIGYMKSKGIPVDIQEIAPGRVNVVARLKGRGTSEPLMFSGHTDVVPVSEIEEKLWQVEPFSGEIKDGMIFGRGSVDMKGGLGGAMVALGTLAQNGIEPAGDIVLAATVDEEDLMRGSKALIQSALISDVTRVIVCEPTNMCIQAASRGRTWAEITVKGQTAHASVRGAGVNAIDRAALLMGRMQSHQIPHEKHPFLGESFWQTTLIRGGIEPAIVPDWCTITVDGRLVPGQMPDDMWSEMEKLITALKQEISDFRAEIKIIEKREPWETPHEDKVVQTLDNSCNFLGIPIKHAGFLGTTDATIFRRIGIPGVIYGPGTIDKCHKENEALSIEQIIKATQLYLTSMLMW